MGRAASRFTVFYRPACNSRECPKCRPIVLNRWMDRVPAHTDLYVKEIREEEMEALRHQFKRARARDVGGQYAHIPMEHNLAVVFTDADMAGREDDGWRLIDHAEIRAELDHVESNGRRLTTSKGWWAVKPEKSDSPSFIDEGVTRSSMEWNVGHARRNSSGEYVRTERRTDFVTTEEQHDHLKEVAGVHSDAEYWAERKPNPLKTAEEWAQEAS